MARLGNLAMNCKEAVQLRDHNLHDEFSEFLANPDCTVSLKRAMLILLSDSIKHDSEVQNRTNNGINFADFVDFSHRDCNLWSLIQAELSKLKFAPESTIVRKSLKLTLIPSFSSQ